MTTEHSTLAINETDHSYTITCSSGLTDGVLERIENFFKENTIREEFVAAASVGMATVVNRYLQNEIAAVCSDFVACKVSVDSVVDGASEGHCGFLVHGTVHGLRNAVKRMSILLAKVVEREKTMSRPGIPQYLHSPRGQQAISSIETQHQACIREVTDDVVSATPVPLSSAVGFSAKMTISVGKKFITKIVVGDITEYKVDAIVNAANGSLDHAGGVARSIVDKGMAAHVANNGIFFLCVGMLFLIDLVAPSANVIVHFSLVCYILCRCFGYHLPITFYPHMLISFTFCVFVCMVMDFSAKDKASGVKFCTAVCRHPVQ